MNNLKASQFQIRNDDFQRKIKRTSNDELFEQMLSAENMRQDWKQVKSNKGRVGSEGEKPSLTRFCDFGSCHIELIIQFSNFRSGTLSNSLKLFVTNLHF